jgi:hypothetical protein
MIDAENTEQYTEILDDYTEYFSSYHDQVYEEVASMIEGITPVSDTANVWSFITQGIPGPYQASI